jgi:4-hydroxybenzoate polyprenyltransferase
MPSRHPTGRGDRGGRTAPRLKSSALDYLFALRPLLWIPAIALFEAGRSEADRAWLPSIDVIPVLVALLALLGAVHLANGWRDRHGDRLNRKGGAIAAGRLKPRVIFALGAAALVLAALAAWAPSVSPAGRLLLAIALLLGALYVMPPMEVKRRPGLDLFAQALGYGLVAFLLGASRTSGQARPAVPLLAMAVPYALGIATVGVVTMLADRAGDEAAGQRTTVVALGVDRSVALALALASLTAASGLAGGLWAPALWGLLAVASLGLARRGEAAAPAGRAEGGREWNRLAVALQIAFLILLVPRSPVPLAAAVVLGSLAAIYDRSRGGAGYPLRSSEGNASGAVNE